MTVSSLFPQPLRVLLLAGGPSAEREVSLASGDAVERALRSTGHHVTRIDPLDTDVMEFDPGDFDIAFLALHGVFGEDGQVQVQLEAIGLPFTGSDSATSRLAMSKSATKERLLSLGVPTPAYVLIHETDDADELAAKAAQIGYPLVVKPDSQGSSLGVTIVRTPEELPAALSRCFHYEPFGLIEEAIEGAEWTVGMIDDQLLPPIQIVSERPFYDFDAKYALNSTRYLFESELSDAALEQLKSAARRSCKALGTQGIARVDLRVDRRQRPWVLEVNTIPGFTDHSLVPKAAAEVGIDFAELCERALQSALTHHKAARPHAA